MAEGETTPLEPHLERRWSRIRGRMEEAAGALARQGSVASRTTPGGTRVASVRFVVVVEGPRVQRAIYLGGDDHLVTRARDLIRQYREHEGLAREVEEAARFVAASSALLRRLSSARPRAAARLGGM